MPEKGKYSVGYHILYAFANLRADSGEDIHYPGDSWNDKQHRHLKVLLSIGGWTYSPQFHPVVVSPAHRARFYPENDAHAQGYVELLRELRHGLDEHARQKGADYKFLLTIAAPCGPDKYKKLHIRAMDQYLDFWNMMAYDFSGSWDQIANHQANVFGGPINAAEAIHWYIAQGVARPKIVMGIPSTGGTPFSGIGPGSWERGVYDYRALPLPGSHVHVDDKALASWGYDYATREMVSYDNPDVGTWKGAWIQREGLGGSMFWELSGDKQGQREGAEGGPGKEAQPGPSLVTVVKNAMGALDTSPNWLRYEKSKFDNMRKGME
ncbi:glycoside hydrolase [Infundibulicybe gibba]|nr:glycoside hydrolase [Infundibulicybe gibba]